MKDFVCLGPSPCDEDSVSVGEDDYHARARMECQRDIQLIRQVMGPEPEGARLSIKSFPHDFGVYVEVILLTVPPSHRSHGTVGFHAARHGLNQLCHPC
jgi:hypothetical protein